MAKIDRKKTKTFILIGIIIIIVSGIWFVKNNQDKDEVSDKINPDFALNVKATLDLEKLKAYGIPIIIDFGADSCIPCKEMAPVLKELNAELQGKAIIKFVDVWECQELAEGYPISVIPTQIFIDSEGNAFVPKDPEEMQIKMLSLKDTGGHVFTTHEGGLTKEDLKKIINEMGVD